MQAGDREANSLPQFHVVEDGADESYPFAVVNDQGTVVDRFVFEQEAQAAIDAGEVPNVPLS